MTENTAPSDAQSGTAHPAAHPAADPHGPGPPPIPASAPVSSAPPAADAETIPLSAPPRSRPRTVLLFLVLVGLLSLGAYGWQRRSLTSVRDTLDIQVRALSRMQTDARAIRDLQAAPQQASDRLRANEELLAQIDRALVVANVPKRLWQDSVPQAPQRLPHTPYERFTTRVYFEDITMRQLVAFSYALLGADPTLSVAAVRVAAGPGEKTEEKDQIARWHAELAISYLVYAPVEE